MRDDAPTQLENLGLALRQKEVESKGLKQALRVLQAANKKKTSLYPDLESELATTKEELSRTQHQLEHQTESTVRLQYQILRQQEEMRSLKEQHHECVQKLVALEIDLETHDIHFTEYSDQQRRLEHNAMKEAFSHQDNENRIAKYGADEKMAAGELMAKIMSDYAHLEARYKRDAAKNAKRIQNLEQKNQTLTASVSVLEERVTSTNKNVKFALNIDSTKSSATNSNVYRQRINDLETSNAKLLLQYNETKQRLSELKVERQPSIRVPNRVMPGNERGKASLEQQLSVCQQQMALLRTKAMTYQFRTFDGSLSGGSGDLLAKQNTDETCTPSDDESTSDGYRDSTSSSIDASTTTKLQDLKEILKQKDRELSMQRQKFHAREQELVAQLQEVYKASKHPHSAESIRYFL